MSNEYTAQILGTVSAPQLVERFRASTDDLALEHAAGTAKSFEGVRWFMGVRVWKGDDVVVGTVYLNEPTTRVTRGGK